MKTTRILAGLATALGIGLLAAPASAQYPDYGATDSYCYANGQCGKFEQWMAPDNAQRQYDMRGGPRYVEPDNYRERNFRRGERVAVAHERWCRANYRSYREWDNSWKPNRGARRQCISPYS